MFQFSSRKAISDWLFVAVATVAICRLGMAEDGRGEVHSILLNAEALRVFDVLLEIEKSYDIRSDELETQIVYMRMTCDRDRQRFLCISKAESSQYISGDESPIQRVAASGFLRDGEVIRVADPIGKVRVTKRPFVTVLSNFGVPDLRFVGVRGFPSPFYAAEDPASFDSMLKRILVSKSNYIASSAKSQTDSFSLMVTTHEPPGGRVLGRSLEWSISDATLMPKSYREYLRWNDAGSTKKTLTRWEQFEWEEHDGVYVPSTIVCDELGSLNNEQFTIQKTVKLHWLSVNHELEDDVFSTAAMESLEAFQKKIDPTLVDAESKK